MKLLQNLVLVAAVSEAQRAKKRKTLKKLENDENRAFEENSNYADFPPTEACTFFGKHAVTGEDGFGMAYKYDLSYQASNYGFNGFLEIDNYHDYSNCYVDITANPECEAISISYTSVAVETCQDCGCDAFWISTDTRHYDPVCGCAGDGCDDVVWGRNVTNPHTGEEDYYYYNYGTSLDNGEYNYTYIYSEYGTMGENGAELPSSTGQVVLGNKFRFNFQSDMSISHGEVRLDWECIEDATTTAYTTTSGTTTSATTTSSVPTPVYETTPIYDSTWHPDLTTSVDTTTSPIVTAWDNSCYRHHAGHNEFKRHVLSGIKKAIENDADSLSHNGRETAGVQSRTVHFNEWLDNIFMKYHDDITDEENPRSCLLNKVGDSPGDLTMDELGSDCALDIEAGNINNACKKLKEFLTWVYADCQTEGRNILERLDFRCNKINEIRDEIAQRANGNE